MSHMEPEFRLLIEQPPLWRQIYDQVRERLHPAPEPELNLESKPIAVKATWSRESSWRQRLTSLAIHAIVIGILLLPFWNAVRLPHKPVQQTMVMVPTLFAPGPSLPKMKRLAGGAAPRHAITPPKLLHLIAPPMKKVPVLKLTPTDAIPNLQLAALGNIGEIAGPPGTTAGSSGKGPGGIGSSANGGADCVNGPCATGGNITAPVGIYTPDPQYSDAAREAKLQGTVTVSVIIGTDGRVYDPKILQPLGLGLDQKALEALKQWRFRPAERNGHPIRVAADIQVNFHLY